MTKKQNAGGSHSSRRDEPATSKQGYYGNSKVQDREVKSALKKEKEKHQWAVERNELAKVERQLEELGLVVKDVKGDGNCLFRALGDQLNGDSQNHFEYRGNVVRYIQEHREDFEPFMEDETGKGFEGYVKHLAQDGIYAGHWALIAFSRHYGVNIVINQVGQAPWKILYSDHPKVRNLHVVYFGYEHYSSVRNADGPREGPANVVIKPRKVEEPEGSVEAGAKASKQEEKGKKGQKGKPATSSSASSASSTSTPSSLLSGAGDKSKKGKDKWNGGDNNAYYEEYENWDESYANEAGWGEVEDTSSIPDASAEVTPNEKQVMEMTGCNDLGMIRNLLASNGQNVEGVIGVLLDESQSSPAGDNSHVPLKETEKKAAQNGAPASRMTETATEGMKSGAVDEEVCYVEYYDDDGNSKNSTDPEKGREGMTTSTTATATTSEPSKAVSTEAEENPAPKKREKALSAKERKELAKKEKKENRTKVLQEEASQRAEGAKAKTTGPPTREILI